MEDDILTTTQAAKLLGISVRTAQLLIEGGKLPSWKTPGGHRRVHRTDVRGLMDRSDGRAAPAPSERSAVVIVVTTPDRLAIFQQVFDGVGHLAVQFLTSTLSAAITAGGRVPAITVVDLDGCKEDGVALLNFMASDGRMTGTELVAVSDVTSGDGFSFPRVRLATLATLKKTVQVLSEDSPLAEAHLAAGSFPVAPNEASRLQAVRRSGLVNSPAEAPFDRLTWLAASGLKSPIALMTVLTPELQWFKSRQGLDMPETPRSWAFCNHTVLQRGIFEVPDLAEHVVFSGNPAVAKAPNFRFYAGAPVYDPNGFALGSLCVIDFHPRQLDDRERRTLLELAAIATDEVKLRDLNARS